MPARRAPGEGSISQRPDGLWVGRLDISQPGMPRRRKVVYGRTRQQVQRDLGKLRREFEAAGDLPTAALTVEAWMNYWLEHIAPTRIGPTTLPGYRSKVRNYIIPALGRHRLDRLRPEHLRAMYRAMETREPEPLSQNTIRQTHAILARALKVAVREGKTTRNVADLIDAPEQAKQRPEALDRDELETLMAHIAGAPGESRWLAAVALGMRQGECLGLAWEQVDLDVGIVEVTRAKARVDGKVIYKSPKSEKSERVIPLPRFVHEAMRRRWVDYLAERESPGYEDHGLVWGQPSGPPRDARRDYQDWIDLLAAAGVRRVRLHAARGTAATALVARNVPIPFVAAVLGHANIATTMRYVKADLKPITEAMRLLDDGRPEIGP